MLKSNPGIALLMGLGSTFICIVAVKLLLKVLLTVIFKG